MGTKGMVVKQNVNSPKIGDGYCKKKEVPKLAMVIVKKKNLNRAAGKGQSGRIMGCLG